MVASRSSGQTIAEKYRLDRLVDEGGMGEVWAAEHLVTKRRLALKFLKDNATDEAARRRFLLEARASCAVEHPAVVPVMDVLELDGELALVMELLTGESLAARLAREGKLDAEETARLLLPVAEALAAAHALGIVHRDLKPSNIFLTKSGQTRLLDFGIAKVLAPDATAGEGTASGAAIGTPCYMSPEQAFGEKDIDARTDVWSLGLVLYQCLSGTLPTEADSFGKIVKILLSDGFPPLGPLALGAPAELVATIERMLARDRGERLADMDEVVSRLRSEALSRPLNLAETPLRRPTTQAIRHGQSPAARGKRGGISSRDVDPVAKTEPAKTSSRGRRPRATWAAIAVGVAGLAGVGLWARGRISEARRGDPNGAEPMGEVAPAAPVGPLLTKPDEKLGCALFEASGVEEPAGWLGAAASGLACRRMQWLLGGDSRRVVAAPLLLDFKPGFDKDAPDDPYAPPELRERSLSAASLRTAATLDGAVRANETSFTVELRLLDPHGHVAGRGEGTAEELEDAVETASNELAKSGAFPTSATTTPEVKQALLIDRPELGWAIDLVGINRDVGLERHCTKALSFSDLHPALLMGIRAMCAEALQLERSAADRAEWEDTPAAQATSLVARMGWGDVPDRPKARGDQLALALDPTGNRDLYALLGGALGVLKLESDGGPVAFSHFEQLARTVPVEAAWTGVYQVGVDTPNEAARVVLQKSALSWAPFDGRDWPFMGFEATGSDLRWPRRASALSPTSERRLLELGKRLLMVGEFGEVRTLAGRVGESNRLRDAAAYLLAAVDAQEGSPGRGLAVALPIIREWASLGRSYAAASLTIRSFRIAEVLGRGRELADAFAARVTVAALPLEPAPNSLTKWVTTCLAARDTLSVQCLDALVEKYRRDGGQFSEQNAFLDGAQRASRGDAKGAVRVWRPIFHNAAYLDSLPVDTLDAAGEPELARKVDESNIALGSNKIVRNFGMPDLRQARRAWKRGDKAKARELAEPLLDAWSTLDAEVPWLDELRMMAGRN